ncbi:MAG: ABC transporter ATP-binding protein [Clostridia bacterium]|nr:ABC transporter ATP-binding protein [Clostridia bacterium]
MIEVRHLTKKYGNHIAVDDLSFTIDKGVIYGFLGPNGAGKSTTMNIITGCLGATAGEVLIDGHSIAEEPLAAKKLIGYLPEMPPVYMDMTPDEYLRFIMQARKIPAAERAGHLKTVMEKTRITEVKDRLIRNLSKGYRQRVGIAQALIGDPEIIILDEPTVGLDPAQIIEIRELIRELGQDHTIVLSSHILSEVQAVCDSIMIISGGRLVASDTAENLTALFAGKTTLKLEIRAGREQAEKVLNKVEGIDHTDWYAGDENTVRADIHPTDDQDLRERIFRAFAEADLPLLEMTRIRASLEDVFIELTGAEASPDPAGGDSSGNRKNKKAEKNKDPETDPSKEADDK